MKKLLVLVLCLSLLMASMVSFFSCNYKSLDEPVGTTTVPMITTGLITTTAQPSMTTPPMTTVPTPETNKPPVSGEESKKTCMEIFSQGFATTGKTVTVSRELTAEELQTLITFIRDEKELRMILAASHVPFYRAEDFSLYELLYASDIKTEYPDNPYGNNGSMMTTARIREIVQTYLGIDVTSQMLERLGADGAEYFPELDAYGFVHTDLSDFYPDTEGEIFGYETEDGKLLVHLVQMGNLAHVQALLVPEGDTYRVEAAEWINSWNAYDGQ